jgi:hypothetical protein
VGNVHGVTDQDDADPERLLAEALRAQAARTPAQTEETTSALAGYGLLSGSDVRMPLAIVDDPTVRAAEQTSKLTVERQVPASLILLLALLLGLAAGAVVGLLTLL